ncbi:hypothetical protein SAY86_028982 [Trapa natans]|uniref:RING-type domain-containing protein n=1 Tax=Trapa natans TaxID=22666 RepID=A0AAN7MK24_TRANT|nr:hypothetical protein SAY86_028982 [Trapa natans]
MDVPSLQVHSESTADTCPLLMERRESRNSSDHVIDIRGGDASPCSNYDGPSNTSYAPQNEEGSPAGTQGTVAQSSGPSTNGINTRTSSSSVRRGDNRPRMNPLNSGLWISIELVLTVSQIVASVVVLSISRNEHPHTPLFVWIVGYATGCFSALPLLYWRYRNRNQVSEHDPTRSQPASPQINAGAFSVSVTGISEGDDQYNAGVASGTSQSAGIMNARLKALMEYFKMGLDCFFAVWFVVGNVWIFGGHPSANEAPNMYRLCIVFLTVSCIGYAMPFILCATICCCLPCIISALGFREDLSRTRGATTEVIDALPTYKFKLKKSRGRNDRDSYLVAGDGGVVAAGTERERTISGEDAVCCICLAKYANNDELRELQCSHFFHKDCVDKWLKINALCPLCKSEVGAPSNPCADAN